MCKTIIAIVLLILIIAFGIIEQVYVQNSFEELVEKCDRLMPLIVTMDKDAYIEAKQIYDWCDSKKNMLELFTPHTEIKDLMIRLSELVGYIYINDQKSAVATLYIVQELANITPHFFGVHWEHVL